MYNRYIPQPDGSFCRRQIQDTHPTHKPDCGCTQAEPPDDPPCHKETAAPILSAANCRRQCPNCRRKPCKEPSAPHSEGSSLLSQILPKDFDTGDLMVILLLLLMAGDCPENQSNALLTLALYLFL
jgi:hypothetical protein